jgi:hypothetical protein
MKVLAAIGSPEGADRLLRVASAVAALIGGDVEAVHAGASGANGVRERATAASIPCRELPTPVAEAIIAAAGQGSVAGVVLGRPRLIAGRLPTRGWVARVISSVTVPVVVVPREVPPGYRLQTVLVPMRPDLSHATSLRRAIAVVRAADLEVVVLHVRDRRFLPRFDDQVHHEVEAWAGEFLHRWVGEGLGSVALEVRVGEPGGQVLACAGECGADLIALGWGGDLRRGARIVRQVLAGAHVPVALVPVITAVTR